MVIYVVKHETAECKNQRLYKLEVFPPLKAFLVKKRKLNTMQINTKLMLI